MHRYLTQTAETYRINTEEEVKETLEEFKAASAYEIKKASYEKKQIKEKGEVVDEYWLLTVTKIFNDSKEPANIVDIKYEVDYDSY